MPITSILPNFVGLKSKYNNKYLRYISEDVQAHGFLQFSGEEVLSPYSKYQVEVSKNHDGLVHIRSCYNNKYWVRWSSNYWWIVAGADEPNEDGTSWSCTLFEPVGWDDTDTDTDAGIRLRHVQLGHFVCLSSEVSVPTPFDGCLYAGSASPNTNLNDVCSVVDLESQLVLPKHIAFKGDNDKYLRGLTMKEHPYLQFSSSDIADLAVRNEVFTTPDGSVRIKSIYFDKFWRRSDIDWSWIWADSSDDTTNDPDTLFRPIKVVDDNHNNVVAPFNLGNNKFCKRLTIPSIGIGDSLSAVDTTISIWGRIEVAELVASRDIFDVKYRVMDARIYDQRVVVMATEQVTNTTDQRSTKQLNLTYQETKSRAWKSSVSLKFKDELTLQSDDIPSLSRGRLEFSEDGFSGEYVWGEANLTTTKVESPYIVTVPPRTRVIVSKIATQAYYDVPFSYSQQDTLMDGTIDTLDFDDGVYTSFNSYNYKYETKEEPL